MLTRRMRYYLIRLVVLVPAAWLCALLVFSARDPSSLPASHEQQKEPLLDNHPKNAAKKPFDNEIRGFGPPIGGGGKLPESMGGGQADELDQPTNNAKPPKMEEGGATEKRNVVKAGGKDFQYGSDDHPIYKKGDSAQPGEKGKSVNIDKKVSFREV